MDPLQFEEISNEIQMLYKPMKNIIEMVFATSPLMALSTHGGDYQYIHSTFLLRVSDFLVILVTLNKDLPDIPSTR